MEHPDLGILRFSARILSTRVWKRRIVFWLGALTVGLAAIVFADLSDLAQAVSLRFFALAWWLPLVATPLGFLLCAWLTQTIAPAASGSGIPQAMAARSWRSPRTRTALLGPKVFLSKIVITALALVVGASVGREGPTVQIGAGLMLLVGRWGGIRREQGLILAGSAAGIAGAFNTPLAGVVFAIEEMSRSFEARTNGLVLYAVIIAGLASLTLVGDYTYFGTSHATVGGPRDWLTLAVVGVAGGLAGGVFGRAMLEGTRLIGRWCRAAPLPRRLLVAGICGLVVAAIGLFAEGSTFGTGYAQARAAVEGRTVIDGFWVGKFLATLVTALSGIPGGIFAPSLSVGAGLGDWIGSFLGGTAGLAAVLGMASYFAGAVQSPMTAFVIIMEMTNNQSNLVPLMLASILGYAVSRWVAPEPLYHGLSLAFAGRQPPSGPEPTR